MKDLSACEVRRAGWIVGRHNLDPVILRGPFKGPWVRSHPAHMSRINTSLNTPAHYCETSAAQCLEVKSAFGVCPNRLHRPLSISFVGLENSNKPGEVLPEWWQTWSRVLDHWNSEVRAPTSFLVAAEPQRHFSVRFQDKWNCWPTTEKWDSTTSFFFFGEIRAVKMYLIFK